MEFLTRQEAADILKVTPHTIDCLRANCGLPFIRLDKAVRIPKEAFNKWLEARLSEGPESLKQTATLKKIA